MDHLLDRDRPELAGGSEVAPTLDVADLLDRLNGDRTLLAELVGLFKAEAPRVVEEIRQVILAGDAPRLERLAHKFLGSVRVFGAGPAARVTHDLESLARSGVLTGADQYLGPLEREVQALTAALDRLIEASPP
jgi:two-component system sensor histidine kinase/response regulator